MSVELPTPRQLREIADHVGLSRSDGDVASFIELMRPSIAAYIAVDASPTTCRP